MKGETVPQMTTPKQLFEHELQDVYYAEKTIEKMLPKLASEATTRELSRAFESHLKETRDQIKNLERVFGELGKSAKGEACPGIDGIKAEHDKFMEEEQPSSDIRDLFLTGAAARTEHYEIAAYTGLISMARKLGEKQVVELLDKNLRQEKDALKKVETISKKILTETTKANGGGTSATARSKQRASR
jgi:ferritin-like metal-binding protein YciE